MASQSYQLIMRTGPTPGKVFELGKNEIYIGRDVSNDIVVNDSEVSRKHARLVIQAGGLVVEDLGSTNGTFVNGQRLMGPHVLRPGEMIMLGENISLAFETSYDVDATVVSAPAQPVYPPPPRQTYVPPAQPTPGRPVQPPPPVYSGQIPEGPLEPSYEAEPESKGLSRRTWIIAGCGCLLVAACVVVGGLFAVDSANLWCVAPFKWISFLYPLIGGAVCP
jgi:hypothetical protein